MSTATMIPVPGQAAVQGYVPAQIPLSGDIINIVLSQVTMAVVTFCITRRVQAVQSWGNLPISSWLAVLIYCDSFFFVLLTAIVSKGLGINSSKAVCEGGIILCLACYVTTKVMMYLFLVEKAYLVRGTRIPRMQETQYRWNFIAVILIFTTIITLNFVFRIARIDNGGQCIIGMDKVAMIPLITFEVIVNIYLTTLFIIPLRKLYSYKQKTNTVLRRLVLRSFVGSCTTLTSSVTNLTILMILNGEPGWICLMLCNADVLFSVVVLHWVTSFDSMRSGPSKNNRRGGGGDSPDQEGGLSGPNAGSSHGRDTGWRVSQRRGDGFDLESVLGTRCSDQNGRTTRPQVTTEIRVGSDRHGSGVALDTIDVHVKTEQRIFNTGSDDGRAHRSGRTRINRETTTKERTVDELDLPEEAEMKNSELMQAELQTACSEDSGKQITWGDGPDRTMMTRQTRYLSPTIGPEHGHSVTRKGSDSRVCARNRNSQGPPEGSDLGTEREGTDGSVVEVVELVGAVQSAEIDYPIPPSRSPVSGGGGGDRSDRRNGRWVLGRAL